jgi:hypothetical protein
MRNSNSVNSVVEPYSKEFPLKDVIERIIACATKGN